MCCSMKELPNNNNNNTKKAKFSQISLCPKKLIFLPKIDTVFFSCLFFDDELDDHDDVMMSWWCWWWCEHIQLGANCILRALWYQQSALFYRSPTPYLPVTPLLIMKLQLANPINLMMMMMMMDTLWWWQWSKNKFDAIWSKLKWGIRCAWFFSLFCLFFVYATRWEPQTIRSWATPVIWSASATPYVWFMDDDWWNGQRCWWAKHDDAIV